MERTIVGIDVGTTKVCTLVAEVDDDERLHIVGVGVVPSRGLRKGVIVNVNEVMTSIAESIDIAEQYPADVERLRAILLARRAANEELRRSIDASATRENGVLSEEDEEKLRAIGYVE